MPTLFVPDEQTSGETRAAATPETVKRLVAAGFQVWVQAGAGRSASFPDQLYTEAGAEIVSEPKWAEADVVVAVEAPSLDALSRLRQGAVLVAFLAPHKNLQPVRTLAARGISSLAMELVPRITRAQSMDALSSQASIAGYKAVLLAAWRLGKYFPLLMTAAGTIKPARVVIMGAGVAGLQAIATAKRLGAVVEVSDIRPAVQEQVESLGGRFIELPMEETGEGQGGYAKEMGEDFLRRQREIVARHVAAADVVITTAQIPGKRAPILVTRAMVESMRPGSIIVDLAVDSGGNCELSPDGEGEREHQGVLVIGAPRLPSSTAHDATTLYARNVLNLLGELVHEGQLRVDLDNEVVAGALLTHETTVRHAPTAARLEETS